MVTKKALSYINAELDFAEKSLKQWRDYIEANPIHQIEDRWGKKEMPRGGYTMVVTATAEQQIKCVQDTLTKYLALLEVVDNLREREINKVEVRGKSELGSMANKFLAKRNGQTS